MGRGGVVVTGHIDWTAWARTAYGQSADRHTSVQSRRRELRMAEQLLYVPDVGAAFKHQRRSGMPEEMAGPRLPQISARDMPVNQTSYALGSERAAAFRAEEAVIVRRPNEGLAHPTQVNLEPPRCPPADGHVPIARSLPVSHEDHATVQIQVAHPEMGTLRAAYAGGVQHFQDCPVSNANRRSQLRLAEDQIDLRGGQHLPGQAMAASGKLNIRSRIRRQATGERQPPKEAPHGQEHLDLGTPREGLTVCLPPTMEV
jgi:hypothetical protein